MFVINAGIIPSSESDFITGESQETFKNTCNMLPDWWRYKDERISYKINSHGFRAREFNDIDWNNSIALVGCSYIFGTGVAEKDTVGYYLSQLTNMSVINLGMPGIGNDGIFINACKIQQYKPKYTIVGWTHHNRILVYKNEKDALFLNSWNYTDAPYNMNLLDYFLDGQDTLRKKQDYQEILNIILDNKFIDYELMHNDFTGDFRKSLKIRPTETPENLIKYQDLINLCFARDLFVKDDIICAHPGSWVNEQIAKHLFSQLQSLNQ